MKPAILLLLASSAAAAAATTPLAVADLKRDTPVDFEREILPVLRENCLACHNQTKAKGELNLETPAHIAKGGATGPGFVAGKSAESLFFKASAHLLDDLVMPPLGNKSNARDLTPKELALLRLWIDQGGRGEVTQSGKVNWSAMPANWSPILSVALSPDGQFAYAGRANQIHVYRVPTRQLVARLEDPAAGTGIAHRDVVNALAVSPDGSLVASAGFREAKLWRRTGPIPSASPAPAAAPTATRPWTRTADGKIQLPAAGNLPAVEIAPAGPTTEIAISPNGTLAAAALTNGAVQLWKTAPKVELIAELRGDRTLSNQVVRAEQSVALAKADVEFQKAALKKAEEEVTKSAAAITKSAERHAANEKDLNEKRAGLKTQSETKVSATKERDELAATLKSSKEVSDAAQKLSDAAKTIGKDAARKVVDARLAAEQAARARTDLDKWVKELAGKTDEAALGRARELAQLTAKDAETKAAVAEQATKAAEHALDELGAKAFAAGQARAVADRAQAEIPGRQKANEERLASATKAIGDLEGAIKKAEIAFGASEFDVSLSKTNSTTATRVLAESNTALSAVEGRLPGLDKSLTDSRRVADEASARRVTALAFSPDNQTLATLAQDGRLNLWETSSGQSLEVLRDTSFANSKLAFADPSHLFLVQTNASRTLALASRWSLERLLGTGDEKSPLADRVNALAFSPDGLLLATGAGEPSRSGEVKLWKTADGSLARDLGTPHSDSVLSLAFSPPGDLLLSGGADRFMRLIDVGTGKVLRNFEGHTHHILAVAWRRDGRTVASGSADSMVKTWNRLTGDRIKNVDTFGKEVTGLAPVGISEQFIAVAGSGQVRVFKETGEQVRTLPAGNAFLQAAAVTPDGRIAAAGGDDGVLRLWTVADGKVIAELPAPAPAPNPSPVVTPATAKDVHLSKADAKP